MTLDDFLARCAADCVDGREYPPPDDPCGFCRGRPVGDAASWLDGKERPPAPCPRCGRTGRKEPA